MFYSCPISSMWLSGPGVYSHVYILLSASVCRVCYQWLSWVSCAKWACYLAMCCGGFCFLFSHQLEAHEVQPFVVSFSKMWIWLPEWLNALSWRTLLFLFSSFSIWKVKQQNPLDLFAESFPFFLSLCAAAARYEGESEAESITSFMDTSNPLYQLYDTVRSCRNNQGQLISEPFFQLPSKKKYPDYYQQIKTPISLQQIR